MQEAFDEETYKTNKPKKYGPALVEMKHLFHEIQDLERMSFAGIPDGDMDIGGHGLILVGVRHENAFALVSRSEDDRDDDAPPPGAADGAGDHIVAESSALGIPTRMYTICFKTIGRTKLCLKFVKITSSPAKEGLVFPMA